MARFRLAEYASVRELFRCLLRLREEQPTPYRHLKPHFMAETRVARLGRRADVPPELRDCTPVRFTFEPRSRSYAFRQQLTPA